MCAHSERCGGLVSALMRFRLVGALISLVSALTWFSLCQARLPALELDPGALTLKHEHHGRLLYVAHLFLHQVLSACLVLTCFSSERRCWHALVQRGGLELLLVSPLSADV